MPELNNDMLPQTHKATAKHLPSSRAEEADSEAQESPAARETLGLAPQGGRISIKWWRTEGVCVTR